MFPPDHPPSPAAFVPHQIQTVSELTSSITLLLESEFPFVAIAGEISNLRRPFSGHFYFTLKDTQAQIRCVFFKNQQRYLKNDLTEGAKVICKGRLTVYKQRGEYQIIVDHISDEGRGDIQQQFELLKEKLLTEGLFARETKKKLPAFVHRICLITSPSGAAVHDFLRKALERFTDLEVEILPAAMQGERAAQEIINQIIEANGRKWADVIVLTRGGGSLEDLAPFNDEELARAIHASALPIVSAIGHEVDFTIADFVADYRAPTPTAAAEEVVFDKKQLTAELDMLAQRLESAVSTTLHDKKSHLAIMKKLLADPTKVIDTYRLKVDHAALNLLHLYATKKLRTRQHLDMCSQRLLTRNPISQLTVARSRCLGLTTHLKQQIKDRLHEGREALVKQSTLLDALSPLAVLGRGYALALTEKGRIISSVAQVKHGDRISVRVADGTMSGIVDTTTHEIKNGRDERI